MALNTLSMVSALSQKLKVQERRTNRPYNMLIVRYGRFVQQAIHPGGRPNLLVFSSKR